jgi:hypothetical protein
MQIEPDVCFVLSGGTNIYELEYRSDFGSVICNPFGRSIEYLPKKIAYHGVRCEQSGKLRMLLGFHNSNNRLIVVGVGKFLLILMRHWLLRVLGMRKRIGLVVLRIEF